MNKKCTKCAHKRLWNERDYVITEENRGAAIDEIVKKMGAGEAEISYMERLLKESDGWTNFELDDAVAAFSDGYAAGKAET